MKHVKSVVYLMSGTAHLPYLTASLYSLRRFYKENVSIYAWPESYATAKLIASDLGADCYEREPKYRRKDGVRGNSQFIDKISLMQSLDCETAMYLDADTLVNKPIYPLFTMLEDREFLATQFNDWYVNSKMIRGRVSKMLGVEGINQDSVNRVLECQAPSVNGGVFLCRPETEVLKTWYDWTMCIKKQFIADECALHGMIGEYESTDKFGIVMGGRYNCAPKFSSFLNDGDVAIWHFHGDSNVRQSKSPKGISIWWPIYQECLEANVGGICDWKDLCGNKYIPKLENRPESTCLYCGKDYDNDVEFHNKRCPNAK